MHALFLLHHAVDAPGAIARALSDRGVLPRIVSTHEAHAVPNALDGAAALVVLGGPMAADDDAAYPSLPRERALILRAVDAGVPVLGVCLGAQLLAIALGGRIERSVAREIGWHAVDRDAASEGDPLLASLGATFTPFHWHSDSIELPPGATRLASSRTTPVQAFRAASDVYGLQFHLESDASMIGAMARAFEHELRDGEREVLERETRARASEQERAAQVVFGAWADRVRARSARP